MICTRCNQLSSDADRCSTCGRPLSTLQSQQRRGWVAFGAGAFLVVLMGAIWIWVDRLLFAQGDVAAAQLAGRLNVAFALIVVAGVLGVINGWITAHSGRTIRILVFGSVVLFIGALAIAWRASSG
jgi:hypothetical protein